jgi:hypothetical protein
MHTGVRRPCSVDPSLTEITRASLLDILSTPVRRVDPDRAPVGSARLYPLSHLPSLKMHCQTRWPPFVPGSQEVRQGTVEPVAWQLAFLPRVALSVVPDKTDHGDEPDVARRGRGQC